MNDRLRSDLQFSPSRSQKEKKKEKSNPITWMKGPPGPYIETRISQRFGVGPLDQ